MKKLDGMVFADINVMAIRSSAETIYSYHKCISIAVEGNYKFNMLRIYNDQTWILMSKIPLHEGLPKNK